MRNLNIKDKLKDVNKSAFVKNAMTLTTGTAIAQILPLLIYPFLSRLYSPEQFALLAAYTSFVSILVAFVSGRYESAVFIADNEKEAVSLVYLSLYLPLFLLVCLTPFFLIFNDAIGSYLSLKPLKGWVWYCFIASFLITVFNVYNEWCVRKEYFRRLSYNKITNSIGLTVGKIGFFYTLLSKIGLVVGDFVGRLLTAIMCFFRFYKYDKNSFGNIHFKDLLHVAKKYKEFPLYNMPAQLLNTIGVSIPVFLLASFYETEHVGYYSMTMTILMLPVNIISLSIRDVFRKKANDIYVKDGNYESFFKRMLLILLFASVLVAVLCYPFLPFAFKLVLGEQWYTSGLFAQYMTPMIVFDFVAMSLSGSLIVSQKLKVNFVWQVYYIFITIVSLIVGVKLFDNINNTIILFSLGRCSAYILLIILSFKASRSSVKLIDNESKNS